MTDREWRPANSPWLADVPNDWTELRFGQAIRVTGGQVDPEDEQWLDVTLLAPNHIESGTGRIIGRESARQQGAQSGKYRIKRGQIVLSKIRPALNKVAIADEDCLCSADMYGLESIVGHDPRYLQYFLLSAAFHRFATMMSERVKMPKINREELKTAPILVPPKREQTAIADYLDRETGHIGALIEKQRQLIATLNERLLTFESASFASITGSGSRLKWTVDEFDSRAGSLGAELPLLSVSIAWGVRRRDDVTSKESRAEDLSSYKLCERNDIIINRMRAFQGAIGVATEAGIASPDYAVLRIRPGCALPEFLEHLMRSPPFVAQMTSRVRGIGGTDAGNVRTPRINASDLLDIRVDLPSISEQVELLADLKSQTGGLVKTIRTVQDFVAVSAERRSALITAAVTGQIDVRSAA